MHYDGDVVKSLDRGSGNLSSGRWGSMPYCKWDLYVFQIFTRSHEMRLQRTLGHYDGHGSRNLGTMNVLFVLVFCLLPHKMTQFLGRPQGPLSFSAGSSVSRVPVGWGVAFGVAVGPVEAFCAAALLPLISPFLGPSSHSNFTLLMVFQKSVPCCVAIASSVVLGCLLPSAPANVPAPQALPPRASSSFAISGKVVL
jgi:hypothetical protein